MTIVRKPWVIFTGRCFFNENFGLLPVIPCKWSMVGYIRHGVGPLKWACASNGPSLWFSFKGWLLRHFVTFLRVLCVKSSGCPPPLFGSYGELGAPAFRVFSRTFGSGWHYCRYFYCGLEAPVRQDLWGSVDEVLRQDGMWVSRVTLQTLR